jgi:hypothetical protein
MINEYPDFENQKVYINLYIENLQNPLNITDAVQEVFGKKIIK